MDLFRNDYFFLFRTCQTFSYYFTHLIQDSETVQSSYGEELSYLRWYNTLLSYYMPLYLIQQAVLIRLNFSIKSALREQILFRINILVADSLDMILSASVLHEFALFVMHLGAVVNLASALGLLYADLWRFHQVGNIIFTCMRSLEMVLAIFAARDRSRWEDSWLRIARSRIATRKSEDSITDVFGAVKEELPLDYNPGLLSIWAHKIGLSVPEIGFDTSGCGELIRKHQEL